MLERSNDLLTCEVGRTDLMWCVRHNLLAVEDAGFDELANLMMADTELCALSASPGRCPWGHSLPLRLFLKAEGRAHPLELVENG